MENLFLIEDRIFPNRSEKGDPSVHKPGVKFSFRPRLDGGTSYFSVSAACAAARRAIGTRNGLQET